MKIKSSVKSLEIEFPDGKKRVYAFNVGDKEALKDWNEKAKQLSGFEAKEFDGVVIDELFNVERDLITMILGEKNWKEIYKKCEKSVFAIFSVVTELSRIVKEGIDEAIKGMK